MPAARRVSLLLALLAFGACAGHAPRPSTPAGEPDSGPLAARLLSPWHRTLNFVLSEPAYVAIFEIVPGRGVSVVYPAPFDVAADRPLGGGSHSVFAVPMNVGRWFYADLPTSVSATRPTYLYLIASREPLRIDEVLVDPASLRRTVGFATFTQSNQQRTMDVLDARFVPRYLDDDSWASDWIELWPEPASIRPPADARVLVPSCAEGLVLVAVPGTTPGYVCASRDEKQEPRTPNEPPPPDSATTPPRTPPTEAKPSAPHPRDGKRPNAPKQARAEPMTLTVDYGVPSTSLGDGDRMARPRSAGRYARPWERSDGQTSASRRSQPSAAPHDGYDDRSMRAGGTSTVGTTSTGERTTTRSQAPRSETRAESSPAQSAASAPRSTSSGQ